MNWKRGFRRIALVLTFLGAIAGFFGGCMIANLINAVVWVYILLVLVATILGGLVVWRIYQLLQWLVLGFCDDKQKDEQK